MADLGCGRFAVDVPHDQQCPSKNMQTSDMWDWFPIVFFPLKILVLGVGMFYAIKWHRDQEKKK